MNDEMEYVYISKGVNLRQTCTPSYSFAKQSYSIQHHVALAHARKPNLQENSNP